MWLSKFLDMTEDLKKMTAEIKKQLFTERKTQKLTPLEFTILESIFNNRQISGYDLIIHLNKHFAGTWEAQSGTIYPILNKLKNDGFLGMKSVKSPLGPLKKVYFLTEAGMDILKVKVNKNFSDQMKFVENFLIELASIYIQSYPVGEKQQRTEEVGVTLKEMFEHITKHIPLTVEYQNYIICPNCKAEIDRKETTILFCPLCGTQLRSEEKNGSDSNLPVQE